jgi:Acetyltransferase (GNAT) family
MAVTVEALKREHAPQLAAALPNVWRPRAPRTWAPECMTDVVDWRYWRRPGGATLLAHDNGRCVGLIDAFVRPYLVAGEHRDVRECCDWWADPEYRAAGVGLRLMRRLMQSKEPIIAIGGSSMSLELLPRLGWRRLGMVQAWILPLKARSVAAALLRRARREHLARLLPPILPLARLPRAVPPAPSSHVHEWHPGDGRPEPQPRGCCVTPLLHESELHWLTTTPPCLAEVTCHSYWLHGEPVGFAVAQLEKVMNGIEGKILHVQVGRESAPVLGWIVADVVRRLAAGGAGIVRARSSTPTMSAVLRKGGFFVVRNEPVYWSGPKPPAADAALRLSYIRADDAVPFDSARG